jgi:hypothetical protein
MTDESIVIEIRGDGEVQERIKFLPNADFQANGIEIPLTHSDKVLTITMKDKVIA